MMQYRAAEAQGAAFDVLIPIRRVRDAVFRAFFMSASTR